MTASLFGAASIGLGQIFAVGEKGTRVRRQNGTWIVDGLGASTSVDLTSIAARSAGEIYAVGQNGTILVRRWGTWVPEAQGLTSEWLKAVVLDSEHVWVLAQTQLLEKNLTTGLWTAVDLPAGTPELSALAIRRGADGKARELVLAGARCAVLSFSSDTKAFSKAADCLGQTDFLAAAFLESGDLILTSGDLGPPFRRVGMTLTPENVAGLDIGSIYGLIPDGTGMWGVGSRGTLFRRVAGTWIETARDVAQSELFAGVKDDEGLFVVGASGVVLRRL